MSISGLTVGKDRAEEGTREQESRDCPFHYQMKGEAGDWLKNEPTIHK